MSRNDNSGGNETQSDPETDAMMQQMDDAHQSDDDIGAAFEQQGETLKQQTAAASRYHHVDARILQAGELEDAEARINARDPEYGVFGNKENDGEDAVASAKVDASNWVELRAAAHGKPTFNYQPADKDFNPALKVIGERLAEFEGPSRLYRSGDALVTIQNNMVKLARVSDVTRAINDAVLTWRIKPEFHTVKGAKVQYGWFAQVGLQSSHTFSKFVHEQVAPMLPELKGVVAHPVLKWEDDGEAYVFQGQGYDPDRCLYYNCSADLDIQMTDDNWREMATESLAWLRHNLFGDYSFSDAESEITALATPTVIIQRHDLKDGAPLIFCSSQFPESGKSTVQQIAVFTAIGTTGTSVSFEKDEQQKSQSVNQELKKSVPPLLAKSPPALRIDNLNDQTINSDFLSTYSLTPFGQSMPERILRTSSHMDVQGGIPILLNGTECFPTADMATRSLSIDLDSSTVIAESHKWTHVNAVEFLRENYATVRRHYFTVMLAMTNYGPAHLTRPGDNPRFRFKDVETLAIDGWQWAFRELANVEADTIGKLKADARNASNFQTGTSQIVIWIVAALCAKSIDRVFENGEMRNCPERVLEPFTLAEVWETLDKMWLEHPTRHDDAGNPVRVKASSEMQKLFRTKGKDNIPFTSWSRAAGPSLFKKGLSAATPFGMVKVERTGERTRTNTSTYRIVVTDAGNQQPWPTTYLEDVARWDPDAQPTDVFNRREQVPDAL